MFFLIFFFGNLPQNQVFIFGPTNSRVLGSLGVYIYIYLKAAPVREAHGIPSRVSIAATLLSHGGEKVRKRADMFGLGGPRFP